METDRVNLLQNELRSYAEDNNNLQRVEIAESPHDDYGEVITHLKQRDDDAALRQTGKHGHDTSPRINWPISAGHSTEILSSEDAATQLVTVAESSDCAVDYRTKNTASVVPGDDDENRDDNSYRELLTKRCADASKSADVISSDISVDVVSVDVVSSVLISQHPHPMSSTESLSRRYEILIDKEIIIASMIKGEISSSGHTTKLYKCHLCTDGGCFHSTLGRLQCHLEKHCRDLSPSRTVTEMSAASLANRSVRTHLNCKIKISETPVENRLLKQAQRNSNLKCSTAFVDREHELSLSIATGSEDSDLMTTGSPDNGVELNNEISSTRVKPNALLSADQDKECDELKTVTQLTSRTNFRINCLRNGVGRTFRRARHSRQHLSVVTPEMINVGRLTVDFKNYGNDIRNNHRHSYKNLSSRSRSFRSQKYHRHSRIKSNSFSSLLTRQPADQLAINENVQSVPSFDLAKEKTICYDAEAVGSGDMSSADQFNNLKMPSSKPDEPRTFGNSAYAADTRSPETASDVRPEVGRSIRGKTGPVQLPITCAANSSSTGATNVFPSPIPSPITLVNRHTAAANGVETTKVTVANRFQDPIPFLPVLLPSPNKSGSIGILANALSYYMCLSGSMPGMNSGVTVPPQPCGGMGTSGLPSEAEHTNCAPEVKNLSRTPTGDGCTMPSVKTNGFSNTKCSSLSRTHSRLDVIRRPIRRHDSCTSVTTSDGRSTYKCLYCRKDFSTISDVNRHMDFHEDIRPYKCRFCSYFARTNSQLKVHMMRHQGIREFICKLCSYKGVTQSDLNRHTKSQIHRIKSRNECRMCREGFISSVNLDQHFRDKHSFAVSPYITDIL